MTVHTHREQSGYTLIEILVVVGIVGILGAFAVPMFARTIANFRLSGDARGLSNAIAVAKIRAAAKFARVRLYVDLPVNAYHLEWRDDKTDPANPHWTAEGGSTSLSYDVGFGYTPVATPPLNTQDVIGQASDCLTDAGEDIANTGCIIFNSRGVPVDTTGAPNGEGAFYLEDNTAVYGVTVGATGTVHLWRTFPRATPTWVQQ